MTGPAERERAAQATAHTHKIEGNPHKRARVIRALARGDKSMRRIAREEGVVESSIREFRDRHLQEIADDAAELQKGLDSLWIAKKLERLGALEREYKALEELPPGESARIRIDILRKAAEELGEIPNRVTLATESPLRVEVSSVSDEGDV